MNNAEVERQLLEDILAGRANRRQVLRRAALLGLSAPVIAGLLAACGGDDDEETAPTATAASGTTGQPTATTGTAGAATPATGATPGTGTGTPAVPAGSPTTTSGRRGGSIVVANEADPGNFDPAQMVGLPPRRIGRCIYNALVSIDEAGNVQPELIESWEQPDERSYLLKCRRGVKFHDGTDFNAEAVKFHFDRHLDPNVKSLRAGELSAVASTEIVDEYSVRVNLKQPFAPFLAALFDWSGFVVSPAAVEQYGQDYGFNPVGTGPFKFVSYAKDNQTIVERNPGYWEQGLPYLDRITFRSVPVDSTRLTELRSGGVQIAENIPLQDAARLQNDRSLVISIRDGFRFDYMHFVSTNDPYGSNKMLRQAVNYAINREEILQGAFFGIGAVGYQPFFPGTPYHDPNFQPYEQDVNRAKELIRQSGVPTPIQWTVGVTSDPVKQRVTQIVQAQLAEVDIQINIQQMDVAAYRESVLGRGEQFYVGFGWWGWRPDPDQYLSTLMFSGSNNNYGNINNPRVDELLAQGRAASEQQERIRLYRELRDIISEDSIYIYYWEGPDIKGVSPTIEGFNHRPDTIIRYSTISLKS